MNGRSVAVWILGTALVLLAFLAFVAFGWPGAADTCTASNPDSCYCERFVLSVVHSNAGGVRQASNTWFNLYAIATSGVVALRMMYDRRHASPNLIRSASWIGDVYVFAVLFLGLGSMWFHASLKGWAGNVDGLSMYVYAAFLVFYTAVRKWGDRRIFWIGYPLTVVLFTVVGAIWQWELKSLVLILVLVLSYLGLEFWIWAEQKAWAMGATRPRVLWVAAVVSIATATTFWVLSQTGRPLCFPDSWFQPHGLLWHPLAGVMATLLYFYWRVEPRTAGAENRPIADPINLNVG